MAHSLPCYPKFIEQYLKVNSDNPAGI